MWSYPVLDPVSQAYPGVEGRSPTCYSPVRHSSTSASTGLSVRLACVKHAASVHPEPGSNSPQKIRKKRAVKSPKPDKQKTDKKKLKSTKQCTPSNLPPAKPSFEHNTQGGQPPPAHTNTTSRHTTQAVPADKPQETHHKKYINTLSSSHTTQAHQDQHPFEGDDPRKLGSTEVNTVADFRQPRVNPRYPPPSRDPVTGQHLTW